MGGYWSVKSSSVSIRPELTGGTYYERAQSPIYAIRMATAAFFENIAAKVVPHPTTLKNRCNRHADCAGAAEAYKAKCLVDFVPANFHCYDEDCEDCFGS